MAASGVSITLMAMSSAGSFMPATGVSQDATVTIGTLSGQSGVSIETIRFYERIGMLPKARRNPRGHRIYDRDQLKRLTFLRRGRELGFSLDQIRDLLRLVDGARYTCTEVKAIILSHLEDVRRNITDLRRLELTLTEVAGKCSGGSAPDCPIIDALFDPRR